MYHEEIQTVPERIPLVSLLGPTQHVQATETQDAFPLPSSRCVASTALYRPIGCQCLHLLLKRLSRLGLAAFATWTILVSGWIATWDFVLCILVRRAQAVTLLVGHAVCDSGQVLEGLDWCCDAGLADATDCRRRELGKNGFGFLDFSRLADAASRLRVTVLSESYRSRRGRELRICDVGGIH